MKDTADDVVCVIELALDTLIISFKVMLSPAQSKSDVERLGLDGVTARDSSFTFKPRAACDGEDVMDVICMSSKVRIRCWRAAIIWRFIFIFIWFVWFVL